MVGLILILYYFFCLGAVVELYSDRQDLKVFPHCLIFGLLAFGAMLALPYYLGAKYLDKLINEEKN